MQLERQAAQLLEPGFSPQRPCPRRVQLLVEHDQVGAAPQRVDTDLAVRAPWRVVLVGRRCFELAADLAQSRRGVAQSGGRVDASALLGVRPALLAGGRDFGDPPVELLERFRL